MNNNIAISGQERLYSTPETEPVFVKVQSILCISNPDANTTEMEEGDYNW